MALVSAAAEPPPSLLADLTSQERAAARATLADGATPDAILDAVFAAADVRSFDAGSFVIHADSRWFSSHPPAGAGAPRLELRRWPGDTVVALYVLAPTEGVRPPLLGGSSFERSGAGDDGTWNGTVVGEAGPRRALWRERAFEEAAGVRVAALVVAGDAGFGDSGVAGLEREALRLLERIEVRLDALRGDKPILASTPLLPPSLTLPPGDGAETDQPWQVAVGPEFTIGLPPGLRAARLDAGVGPQDAVRDATLWIRGRYVDEEGTRVVIGDAERFGYVARIAPLPEGWSGQSMPPRGAPTAELVAAQEFPTAVERCAASAAQAMRWTEPGFGGDWIVFRLAFVDHGIEIALPLLEGRRSPSLYWIPLTWRSQGLPPAPPPVDPAKRFGIRFERLLRADHSRTPWLEGFLYTPGLRVEVARGFLPSAALRSADGFPVRFVHESGGTRGTLRRLSVDEVTTRLAVQEGLREAEHPKRHRARVVWVGAEGFRLFVAETGEGFLFERSPGDAAASDAELWELMLDSVRLQ